MDEWPLHLPWREGEGRCPTPTAFPVPNCVRPEESFPLMITLTDTPYRGYLIKYNYLNETYTISTGGSHICFAASVLDAKRIIDDLIKRNPDGNP
jgi:hypothetical protein